MEVTILIPAPFRPYTDRKERITLPASSVDMALQALTTIYPQLRRHLFSDENHLRSYITLYLNGEETGHLEQGTALRDADVIRIVPSVAGGGGEEGEQPLSREEMLRYSRHLILPEVGVEGQKRLKAARVLVVGAGGLGSPVALYLAAAGVGKIGIVDFDVVDLTNLQRQVMHSTQAVGRSKLDSARRRIAELNPHVEVLTFEERLTSANALRILGEFDVIVDGTDNFPTRYLLNDACVLLGKPNVYGSIFRFEGQVSVFDAARGPCYRCLYASPPPPGLVPSCAEGGVLGVLPGVVGSLQALEAMKIILQAGELLIGRLLLFDALSLSFRELKLKKNPDCPVCSAHPTLHALIDYDEFCGVSSSSAPPEGEAVTPAQLKARLDRGDDIVLIDVREESEFRICNIGGRLIPLKQLPQRLKELDAASDIVVYCKTGRRSAAAVELLRRSGFAHAANLIGGIDRWIDEIDPSLTRY
jgi:molybdopterin/thiamine biosynthesis adenylyltransferase/rhodanese-related sulfurtransferase/molybdopterin converting factor small subunit